MLEKTDKNWPRFVRTPEAARLLDLSPRTLFVYAGKTLSFRFKLYLTFTICVNAGDHAIKRRRVLGFRLPLPWPRHFHSR